MTTFIRTLADFLKFATTGESTPAQALLTTLERIKDPLKRKGWELTIYNQGTNTVQWVFLKPATDRTVCRRLHVIPIAHYPITA